MPLEGWLKIRMYWLLGCLAIATQTEGARPRFDTSTDMGLVLVPADAELDSVIFRLRATDQDADFPLIFDITATVTPVVRIENLPCTLYNKICQANVILTRRLVAGRLHDFAVRVRDSKGDSNSMQATISVTNATTQRDRIFPHIPAIIMVPEDTKPGKELDYILVRSNQWSGKPVYIELWQPKELFTIRQRQTPAETRGVITLIGELDFETQSMYTLTIYATDPYTEPKKDTRNIAGLHLVIVVQDVQDVPPIFTLAPPLTKINNTVKPGDIILRVHAEDGDKGVPREVTYGLVSEGNPFTPFFNISETTGEIILARPLEELTQITHVGAPVVLRVVAEEIRKSTMEPPAQATVVEVGLLLGEPGNSPPFFDNDNYVAWIDENAEPGTVVTFTEHYSSKVRDEDVGKAGVFALKLGNNNGTFEISPTVAERTANFIITVRDNSLIDYETHKSLRFRIIAQEVGPATNLSATVPAVIFLRDINDNPPKFEVPVYEVTLSENENVGTRVVQVHATDKDTGIFGRIQYTRIIGQGNEAFVIDPDTGIITVAMTNSALDREITPSLQLSIEARDEDGKGLRGTVPLIVNILDVNDNGPIFQMKTYRFTLNEDMTNFTVPAIMKATDADAEPPNNDIRYEIIHGNYDNKFNLNEITGELYLRESINKIRRTRHNPYKKFATKFTKGLTKVQKTFENMTIGSTVPTVTESLLNVSSENKTDNSTFGVEDDVSKIRKKREVDVLFTLTARAYDLGVPHMSGLTQVSVLRGPVAGARTVMFVVSGDKPDPVKIAETLAAITGGRIVVQEIRPYTISDIPNGTVTNIPTLEGGKKSIVVARVEPNDGGTSLVDIERIRTALAANGVGVIGMDNGNQSKPGGSTNINSNTNITTINSEQVTIYKAENRLLFWLLIILGLLMLIALIALIICCICPGCPFYMAPRKRRVHSSETLIARSDGRPKRHLHRKHARMLEATWNGKKQAWSADPMRRNWQFNRRNHRAPGLASLPGDVRVIDREHEILEKTESLRLHDGPIPMYLSDPMRRPEDERIYMEDVEGLRTQGYGVVDIDSLRQHDLERGPDMARQIYIGNEEQRLNDQLKFVREQHFYRDGNAEVMRLVTRGQIEDAIIAGHRPQTLMIDQGQSGTYRIDGKDILLQRFIEDQKMRHSSGPQDLNDSMQDIEHRSMESHQRQKETINLQQQQQKILLIPERLEAEHRKHIEELGPDVQRLIIDHGSFEKTARFESKDNQEIIPSATLLVHAPMPSKVLVEQTKEEIPNVNVQHYSIHDLELARQNALLTRLLLEKDGREVGPGAMIDSASYLETQSLPGQVAIATQTDRTTATQTDLLPSRSRSDNDESEEEARMRKKLKSKKRHGIDEEPKRIRTLWMKSPIKEEDMQYSTEKRANSLRKKVKDIKDSRRISLETDILREISDSLDENGDIPSITRRRDHQDSNFREDKRNENDYELIEDKQESRSTTDDQAKRKNHRTKHDNVIEPSFRILEKEMNSLSKKLSKLASKKILQSSNGSETDSQEKIKTMDCKIMETKGDPQASETKKPGKVAEITKTKKSKSTERTTVAECVSTKEQVKIRDEVVVECKTRQGSKFRKSQIISTGSSDFEEASEKPKKQANLEKQKQMTGKTSHVRLKRQSKVEQNEPTKALRQEALDVNTSDSASKGSITPEVKSESLSSTSSVYHKETKPKGKERIVVEVKKGEETDKASSEILRTVMSKGSPVIKSAPEATVIEVEGKDCVVEGIREEIGSNVVMGIGDSLHIDKKVKDHLTGTPSSTQLTGGTETKEDVMNDSLMRELNDSMQWRVQEKVPEVVTELKHVLRNEELSEYVQMEVKKIVELAMKEKETVKFEDKKSLDGVSEEEAMDHPKLKQLSETVEFEDKKSLDDEIEMDYSKLECGQSSDVMEIEEKTRVIILKEVIPETVQFGDKKNFDSRSKEENLPVSSKLNYEKSLEAEKQEEAAAESIKMKHEVHETVEIEDKNILDDLSKKKETPVSPKLDYEKISEAIQIEDTTKVTKLKNSDHCEKCADVSKDTKCLENQEEEKRKVVPEESEDAAMFSDSFCGTAMHPKDSVDTQGDEFSYESLQSESSEEQITTREILATKDPVEDTVIESIDRPPEILVSSENETKEDIADTEDQPRTSPPKTPNYPENEEKSTVFPHELQEKVVEIEEPKIEIKDTLHLETKELDADAGIPKVDKPDVPKDDKEPVKSLTVDSIVTQSVEGQNPIVPELDINISDETNVELHPEESELKSLASGSPRSLLSLLERVEISSPKEFGIADSLFVDAKLLKVHSRSESDVKDEKLNDTQTNISIDVPRVNLIEFSREMLDDADDSDSSEASSRTTLTAIPYGTPRHRPISATDDIKPLETFDDRSTIEILSKEEVSVAQVGMPTETESEIPSKINQLDGNKKDVTPAEEERVNLDSAASEKVQVLYQIPQENLTADDDGFDYLPEKNKTLKGLEDTKLPEVAEMFPIESAKTEETPTVPIPKTRKTLKDTKGVFKKRELSKEDVTKSTRKTSLKVLSPKKDTKTKILKEESSKVAKQSIVIGHLTRSQDRKRPIRSTEQVETKIDTMSRVIQAKSAWRKGDRLVKNAQQQDKAKLEKKTLSKSETEQSLNKKPSETRSVRERLKDLRVKKSEDKTVKTEKKRKSILESKTQKVSKLQKAHIDQEKIERLEEYEEKIGSIKETQVESLPTEIEELGILSTIPNQEDHEDKEVLVNPTLTVEQENLEEKTSDTQLKDEGQEKAEMGIEIQDKDMKDEVTLTEERVQSKSPELCLPVMIVSSDELGTTVKTLDVGKSYDHSKPKSTEPEKKKQVEEVAEKNVEGLKLDKTLDVGESYDHSRPKSAEPEKKKQVEGVAEENVDGLKLDKTSDVGKSHDHFRPKSTEPEKNKQVEGVAEKDVESLKLDKTLDVEESHDHSRPKSTESEKKEQLKGLADGDIEDSTKIDTISDEKSSPRKVTKKLEGFAEKDVEVSRMDKTPNESNKSTSPLKTTKHRREPEIESQSRYMEWYKLKREEMERKRQERKEGEEDEERPKWLRKSTRQRWFKAGMDDKKMFDPKIGETTPRRKKIKPLVNVESEQLKAIVRQGRALRKAQGDKSEEPQIEIFAPDKPPIVSMTSRYHHHHHLVQHSEYKYEKMPATPFYLHPPSAPHSSQQISPDTHYEDIKGLSTDSRNLNENFDSGIVIQQGGNKLRHQQILEKKSVFDIAYSEAAPSHLRADSTTPPS